MKAIVSFLFASCLPQPRSSAARAVRNARRFISSWTAGNLSPRSPCRKMFWSGCENQREHKKRACEHAGKFTGHVHRGGNAREAVIQYSERGNAKQRAVNGSHAAENARAPEDDSGDGEEF